MTVQECYERMGGDYEDVSARLMKDVRIQKFMLKFLSDKSFEELCSTFEAGDYEEAFRAAHTLKGVSQNLGFAVLHESSGRMTEALRGGKKPEADQILKEVEADYKRTADAIRAYQKENQL